MNNNLKQGVKRPESGGQAKPDCGGQNGRNTHPKGLRHSFAVSAIEKNIPLSLIRNWMGHSSIDTTAIYLNVSGKDERNFAKRMWTDLP